MTMRANGLIAVLASALYLISNVAYAFENIEADVFYERQVREAISAEYATVLAALEKQAASLSTQVRSRDVRDLKKHMYEKAYLMAKCFDKGMSIKKQTNNKLDVGTYSKRCFEV